jgi:hypothetical protein
LSRRLRGLATRFTNSPTVKAFNSWVVALGELRKLRGKYEWEGDLDAMRRDK